MAEEFVRKEHFEEFALRMDERFLGVEKRMEQGFAHPPRHCPSWRPGEVVLLL